MISIKDPRVTAKLLSHEDYRLQPPMPPKPKNRKMIKSLRFFNRCFDKQRLKNFILPVDIPHQCILCCGIYGNDYVIAQIIEVLLYCLHFCYFSGIVGDAVVGIIVCITSGHSGVA